MIPHCDKCSGRTNSTLLACLSQGASKFILEGSSDGLLWLATLANHGEKRHLYSNSTYSAIKLAYYNYYIRFHHILTATSKGRISSSYIGCFDFAKNSSRRGCGRYAPKNETTFPLGFTRIPPIEAGCVLVGSKAPSVKIIHVSLISRFMETCLLDTR